MTSLVLRNPFLKFKMVVKFFALCQNLEIFLVDQYCFENVPSRVKTVLLTLIAYRAKIVSKVKC